MELQREFFPRVQKTVMPRPHSAAATDILGQSGSAWAVNAAIYGDNWQIDHWQGLVEISGSGAALSFYHLLPNKHKYEKEGLYLRLRLAYRTTADANVNIRTFSGRHVTLPNCENGGMFDDGELYWYITDDLTLNINSIYTDEKMWIQRVDWEWMSKEVIYEDELQDQDLYLTRSETDIEQIYQPQAMNEDSVKEFLIQKIQRDDHFAKRCLGLLCEEQLMGKDLVQLFTESGMQL